MCRILKQRIGNDAEYEPAKRYQFFMYYKCGGRIHLKDGQAAGGYRPTIEAANQTDTFHAWSSLDIQELEAPALRQARRLSCGIVPAHTTPLLADN